MRETGALFQLNQVKVLSQLCCNVSKDTVSYDTIIPTGLGRDGMGSNTLVGGETIHNCVSSVSVHTSYMYWHGRRFVVFVVSQWCGTIHVPTYRPTTKSVSMSCPKTQVSSV